MLLNQTPETRDSLLLRLADPADHEAWSRFTEIYRPLVYRVARRHGLQDADAQDLVQKVFVSVAGAVDQWSAQPKRAKFRTWLHTVARNAVVDHLRARKADASAGGTTANFQLQQLSDNPVNSEEVDQEYQRELFRWAAKNVQPEFEERTWLAFWRTAVEHSAIPVVAEEMGMTTGAVYIARSRVMQRLRETVTKYQDKSDDDQN